MQVDRVAEWQRNRIPHQHAHAKILAWPTLGSTGVLVCRWLKMSHLRAPASSEPTSLSVLPDAPAIPGTSDSISTSILSIAYKFSSHTLRRTVWRWLTSHVGQTPRGNRGLLRRAHARNVLRTPRRFQRRSAVTRWNQHVYTRARLPLHSSSRAYTCRQFGWKG